MPVPTISNTYVEIDNTTGFSSTVSVNGSSEFAVGDLLIVFAASDPTTQGLSISGMTGMTEHYDVGSTSLSTACWSKVLEAGDIGITSLTVSWGGVVGRKGIIRAYRFAAGNHNGISGTPTGANQNATTTPDIPALADLDDGENLVFAHLGSDEIPSITSLPSGYTTEHLDQSNDSGGVTLWTGTDVLGGAQPSREMIISPGRFCATGIIAVKEAPPPSGGNTRPGCLRLGIRIGL